MTRYPQSGGETNETLERAVKIMATSSEFRAHFCQQAIIERASAMALRGFVTHSQRIRLTR